MNLLNVAVFLPFLFGLYLIIKRLRLSSVKKSVLNYGFSVTSFCTLILFLIFNTENSAFLIYSSLTYFLISLFAIEYFKKEKEFIFTKQRFYIFLSLLSFNTYLFFISPTLFWSAIFWILQGIIIYIFSYFDIFKSSAAYNINRFYRIFLFGDFSYLVFTFILFKYACLSQGQAASPLLNFSSLDVLLSYSWGAANTLEVVLLVIFLFIALFSRFFIFPFNCFYSFLANSSNVFYLSILTSSSCIFGAYLFLKTLPFVELFSRYLPFLAVYIIFGIVFSFVFILFEKSLKIIFGHVISILSSLFIISALYFNPEYALICYFSSLIIVFLLLSNLFLKGKTFLNNRIIEKQTGFVLERIHIFLFETLPLKIYSIADFIDKKIVKNFFKLPFKLFDFLAFHFNIKILKTDEITKNIRSIIIIFALIALCAIFISLFGNFFGET